MEIKKIYQLISCTYIRSLLGVLKNSLLFPKRTKNRSHAIFHTAIAAGAAIAAGTAVFLCVTDI